MGTDEKSGARPAEAHPAGHSAHSAGAGWLRPAVFGAMDGLVSNVALISGFAGGAAGRPAVILAGLAGLASGAFSMATGEYTSVRSQNEAMRAQIEVERRELELYPQAEAAELAAYFQGQGVDAQTAASVARQLGNRPDSALRAHVGTELGLNLDELPSPIGAAGASFCAFAVGAVIPVAPYLLGFSSFALAAMLAALALFLLGAVVSRFTERSFVYSGARQLLLGLVAASATYGIGVLVNASMG
ncbi:Predicted Fe2+/Mn2+ transporter, VIT1/CCC1 family [Parafrankia irregularis]|uniref:Predicted Fe2+/Mn2+ transporter, VIT1/CCC1 family n=1 Tax=Parafrankia irregularis TaxID=795642 RepID=A0A0S4QU36_9ACTN|nr:MULTISPECIES: VIT1/CCC1 transporter family protein [Parafrankia]MBE3201864.1 VIT1/CCC1 transporter family protein [Parafrankia sp. CH37]CUU58348.1 Predicted Fe2+/Mn2+ transporter, VIT1/CCC1 family [Parafrankia irregularis]